MATSPIIFGPWSGAVTSNSATIKAAVKNGATAQLMLSLNSDLSAAEIVSPSLSINPDMTVVAFDLGGLQPDAEYFYAIQVNGQIVTGTRGRFRTFPPPDKPASFMFICAGDADTGSEHAVFDVIRCEYPLFFLHLGDLHYDNVNSALMAKYRKAYQKTLKSKTQAALYRDTPIVYTWDDHDYIANNTHRLTPGRAQARMAYQECVPHYPLVEGAGDVAIYHAFTVGRVRFLITDTRSERDPQDDPGFNKTMLGPRQIEWLMTELIESRNRYPLVVWVNPSPWIGKVDEHGDEWFGYPNERAALGQFITDEGIRNVCMLSADAHMIAIDDGSNNRSPNGAGRFPVFHASPLDRRPSDKGGPYSHGFFPKSSGQYGVFKVEDDGGENVKVEWIGKRVSESNPIVSFQFTSPRD